MKMIEYNTYPPELSPVNLTAFLCIPSCGFIPVPGPIASTAFPLFIIDDWGNNLVKDEGVSIKSRFKAA